MIITGAILSLQSIYKGILQAIIINCFNLIDNYYRVASINGVFDYVPDNL